MHGLFGPVERAIGTIKCCYTFASIRGAVYPYSGSVHKHPAAVEPWFDRQVNREHSAYGWNSQSGFDGGSSIPLLDVFYNQSDEEVAF